LLRIINKPKDRQGIIKMVDMPHNAVAKIVNDDYYNEHYVVKVHNSCYFNLTEGSYWDDDDNDALVELLPPGEKVVVEFFNKE
jgi:hypothetical protein